MSSTKLITQLTPGQEKRLAAVYEEWLAIGRGCAPLDRREVEKVCAAFYARIGKPAPAVLIFSSPMMCVLAWWTLRDLAKSQLESQLGSQLESQLRSQLWSQLGSQIESHGVPAGFAGQHWCAWEVFYAFCGEIGVRYTADETALLDLWLRQSRGLHWWFPFDGIVIASERHALCSVDDRGRLHAPHGQACGYSDGWGLCAWHGVIIPDAYYTQQPEARQILAEPNIEVRRALIECYDHLTENGRFMLDCGAKLIDSDVQPMRPGEVPSVNELLAVDLPEDPDKRMVALRVIDPSTSRQYMIRVPPDQKTVKSALAWTFGMSPEQYVLEQES